MLWLRHYTSTSCCYRLCRLSRNAHLRNGPGILIGDRFAQESQAVLSRRPCPLKLDMMIILYTGVTFRSNHICEVSTAVACTPAQDSTGNANEIVTHIKACTERIMMLRHTATRKCTGSSPYLQPHRCIVCLSTVPGYIACTQTTRLNDLLTIYYAKDFREPVVGEVVRKCREDTAAFFLPKQE